MLPYNAPRFPLALTFVATLLALLCAWSPPGSAGPQCVTSFREIKFPDGSARVKNYVCKTEGAAKPEIRVEFDRLSETAAGNLIQGTPDPDLERTFGTVRVVNNAVATEAKRLFDEFGSSTVTEQCYEFFVSTAAGGTAYDTLGACEEQRTLWSLTFPGWDTIEMPLISDIKRIETTDSWPEGYNFLYDDYCDVQNDSGKTVFDPVSCASIWRSARAQDVANYVDDRIAYEKMLGFEPTEETVTYYEQSRKYFDLINNITRGNWPDGFLVITGSSTSCGEGASFSLPIRRLILDVAFIENISEAPVTINDLLGMEGPDTKLRLAGSQDAAGDHQRISLAGGYLQPGETIALALGMSFVTDSFGNQQVSDRAYKRIRAAKPGTVFQVTGGSVRKVRESFGPPKLFKAVPYAYGPELQLNGLVLDDQQILFDQASRNFMKLTAYSEEGSCPYLYSWDDRHESWVHHGKVIHAANGENQEMTERKTFGGFRAKFRLTEEELEVSYIDHVKLEVELKDGAGMTLAPDFAAMDAQDGRYAIIKAGDRIEFNFALPPTAKPEDVKQSTLAITGYYRRYSDLPMARQ